MNDCRQSPCENCKSVNNPEDCQNKECVSWKAWFIERWNEMRRGIKA